MARAIIAPARKRRLLAFATALALAGVVAAGLAGCVRIPKVKVEVKRYSIDTPAVLAPADTTLPFSILVFPFQASAEQKGERIMFRDKEHGMDFYYYHRWIVSPARMIGDALSEHLASWGLVGTGVQQIETGVIPTHELYGRLIDLYADNESGHYAAHLDASLTVVRVDPKTFRKETVFQKTYAVTRARPDKNVPSYVEAVNLAVRDWIGMVRSDLEPLFREEAGLLPAYARAGFPVGPPSGAGAASAGSPVRAGVPARASAPAGAVPAAVTAPESGAAPVPVLSPAPPSAGAGRGTPDVPAGEGIGAPADSAAGAAAAPAAPEPRVTDRNMAPPDSMELFLRQFRP